MFGDLAFNILSRELLYCWRADAGAQGGDAGLESKTVLKICWKSSFNYQATKNKAEITGKVTKAAEVEAHDMAGVLLPLVQTASANLSLPPRGRF